MKATRTNIDPAKRQDAINALIKKMIGEAYMISYGASKSYLGVNKRIKGFILSELTSEVWYHDCYIAK
jgi:ABC-type transport system substrate-binding protein